MRHTYQSPAKINWFLHITGRRADGYHSLETVFQRIDWCDEIHITPNHDGRIYLSDSASISVSDNLIYRAALAQWQTEQCPSHWLSRWCKTLG